MTFFTDEQIAAMEETTVRCDFLIKLDFTSGAKYVWNGHYPLTTGGQEWTPMYGTVVPEGLSYTSTIESKQVSFTVSGLPDQEPDLLQLVVDGTNEVVQQYLYVYMQFFDEDWQPIGDPVLLWFGFMQPPNVDMSSMQDFDGSVQSVTITAENAFYNRSKPPISRYTDRDQQRKYPGDEFFNFIPGLKDKTFTYPDY